MVQPQTAGTLPRAGGSKAQSSLRIPCTRDISVDAKAGEGVMVVVPGIVNFNHTYGGDNVIIQTS